MKNFAALIAIFLVTLILGAWIGFEEGRKSTDRQLATMRSIPTIQRSSSDLEYTSTNGITYSQQYMQYPGKKPFLPHYRLRRRVLFPAQEVAFVGAHKTVSL